MFRAYWPKHDLGVFLVIFHNGLGAQTLKRQIDGIKEPGGPQIVYAWQVPAAAMAEM